VTGVARSFSVHALKTPLIRARDDLAAILADAALRSTASGIRDGDIIVVAESPVATAEGSAVVLDEVIPTMRAVEMADRYRMDPRVAEVVLRESDEIVGGIDGFLLSMVHGTLLPNAGVDLSNTPPGTALPLPADPDRSAVRLRHALQDRTGARVGVIIADSRTHAMRLGCSSVAIGCAGIRAVIDERGKQDLFGSELHVTQRAVADNLASAAVLLMGETDESVPAALVRGLDIPIEEVSGVPTIDAAECLFMGVALRQERVERKE